MSSQMLSSIPVRLKLPKCQLVNVLIRKKELFRKDTGNTVDQQPTTNIN